MPHLQGLIDAVNRKNYVVLDTETTGLGNTDEICEIGLLDATGEVLLDTFIRPSKHITKEATDIHGITDQTVMKAPMLNAVMPLIYGWVHGKDLIIYNSASDLRLLTQSMARTGDPKLWIEADLHYKTVSCAMLAYAEYVRVWSDHHNGYRWWSLVQACNDLHIPIVDEHSAIGDCKLTRAVCENLAQL